jgi:hypothetical protein
VTDPQQPDESLGEVPGMRFLRMSPCVATFVGCASSAYLTPFSPFSDVLPQVITFCRCCGRRSLHPPGPRRSLAPSIPRTGLSSLEGASYCRL